MRDFFANHVVRSALLALLIAALIWIWAEGESVSTITLPIRIVLPQDAASGSGIMLIPDDPTWRGVVGVQIQGSNLATSAATALGNQQLRLAPGMPGVPTQPGPNMPLDLEKALSQHPEIKRYGVTISDVEPASLSVRVVRFESKDLPIRIELPDDLSLDGEPTALPATGRCTVPESALPLLVEGTQLLASVRESDLARLRNEGQQTVTGILRAPSALAGVDPVGISPETVTITLRIKKKVESAKLPTVVPVWPSFPPTEGGQKWSIEVVDKFLTDVSVSGPADLVQRAVAGELGITAVVMLSSDDLERAVAASNGTPAANAPAAGEISKPVTFMGLPPGLPPGLVVSAPNMNARVRIIRRASDSQPNPGGGQ